jgi:flavin-dependent dehydrogenase
MPPRKLRSVAILGDGPAGSTLATLLARRGIDCSVFAPARRPSLLVGESLVPAVVPILQRLGVEDEVASYGVHKPGASFTATPEKRMHFSFANVGGRTPCYAYNVPRDRFDATLRAAAHAAGARMLPLPAKLERSSTHDRLELDAQSLAALGGRAPDWIVDATGRNRLVARLLDLPTRRIERRDVALFAHRRGVVLDRPGHVHTDRLDEGWAWRIPLRDRVSVGIVRNAEGLRSFGSSDEEQYEGVLRSDPFLKPLTEGSKRLTSVHRYDNYQQTSLRGAGANWALVGDAFGFVDPVFSSGLYLAMDSAERLAEAICEGSDGAFAAYQSRVRKHIELWHRVSGYYYDGRMLQLFELGSEIADSRLGRLVNPHIAKHLPRVLTGDAATRRYPQKLLDFMIHYGLRGRDPGAYAVR